MHVSWSGKVIGLARSAALVRLLQPSLTGSLPENPKPRRSGRPPRSARSEAGGACASSNWSWACRGREAASRPVRRSLDASGCRPPGRVRAEPARRWDRRSRLSPRPFHVSSRLNIDFGGGTLCSIFPHDFQYFVLDVRYFAAREVRRKPRRTRRKTAVFLPSARVASARAVASLRAH